ncbi:hypothetical protein HW555_001601 [Spodoptera exigua]|uniref:Uncharacterized protein n=1 Tax=Spodoptera exigua TaxID=7107 RepID=A0A835GPP4_SPOEX|nr:hypothetical protein HW555_001601 [Spodoptera exigua]
MAFQIQRFQNESFWDFKGKCETRNDGAHCVIARLEGPHGQMRFTPHFPVHLEVGSWIGCHELTTNEFDSCTLTPT